MLLPASVLGLFSTLAALAIGMLLHDGPLGIVLIIGFTAMTGLLYQAT